MVSATASKKKKTAPIRASKSPAGVAALDRSKSVYIAAGALLLFVFLCYANALGNGFVFDDHGHVLSEKLFRSLTNLPKLLVASYRPLRDISYAIDFAIWGEQPFGFHLTSVLIHLTNTLLVFFLIRRITGQILIATLAALIFGIHPVQVDAVTYISGRRDVLFSLFYLISFHSYLTYRRLAGESRKQPYHLAKVCFYLGLFIFVWGLSLLSKEMAASLPAFIFIWNFCDAWDRESPSWIRQFFSAVKKSLGRDKWLYLAVSLAAPAYIWYSVFYKGGSERARISGFDYWGGSFYTNFLTSIRVHAWYLKQLVVPTPIVQYSGAFDVASTLFEWRVILSLIVVGATLFGGFFLLNKDKLMAFAVISFFVLLLPVSQLIPHHELLADHYLYLPMLSFGLFVALIAQKVSIRSEKLKRVTYGVAAAVLIGFAVMTILRNTVYKDDFTLWKTNYSEVPTSVRAVSSLAGQYATNYPNKGAELYKQCIALDPSYAKPYLSLAVLYQTRDKAREVEDLVQRGLALPDSKMISPGYTANRFRSELMTALAISQGFQGLKKEAEESLLNAISLYQANSQAYEILAGYYHSVNPEKEIETLKQQIALFPGDYYPLQTLSSRLIDGKKYDEAMPYLDRILAMVPNDFYANYQMGQIYRTKKDCATAGRHLNIARSRASSPEDIKAIQEALTQLQQQCGGS